MTIEELKLLKMGSIVRMGKYHYTASGKNSLGETVFERVDDPSIKLMDAIFFPHLLSLPSDDYVLPVKEEEKESKPEETAEPPKKKRGRPKKGHSPVK